MWYSHDIASIGGSGLTDTSRSDTVHFFPFVRYSCAVDIVNIDPMVFLDHASKQTMIDKLASKLWLMMHTQRKRRNILIKIL